MNIFEKKKLDILCERCDKYRLFYEKINYEKLNNNEAQKILWWQKILKKKGLADDYHFFIYSIITMNELKKHKIGYDFLYGMSNNLRHDKDLEEILIKLSGDVSIRDYISQRKLTYLEAALECYRTACIGTYECEKFDHHCWQCVLSHFDPDELYDSLEVRFENAIKNSGFNKIVFGDDENSKKEPVITKK